MNSKTTISVQDRILNIRKHLTGDIEELVNDEYQVVAIHSDSIIVDVSSKSTDMFGYTVEEFIGMNAWLLFTTDSASSLTKNLMYKSEVPYQVNARHKDGTIFKVELKGKDSELAGEPIRTVWLKTVS